MLFRSERANLVLISFFLLLCLGLLHTQDLKTGLDELRIKLPLLVLPVLIFASPTLSKERTEQVLNVFIAAVTASTLISTGVLLGIGNKNIQDIREISLFMSNIRLALLVALAFLLTAYRALISKTDQSLLLRILLLLLSLWLIAFLLILESLTGIRSEEHTSELQSH